MEKKPVTFNVINIEDRLHDAPLTQPVVPEPYSLTHFFSLTFNNSLTRTILRRPDFCTRLPISLNDRPFRQLERVNNMGMFTPVTTSTLSFSKGGRLILVGVPPNISVKITTPSPSSTSLIFFCIWTFTSFGLSFGQMASPLILSILPTSDCAEVINASAN